MTDDLQHENLRFAAIKPLQGLMQIKNSMLLNSSLQNFHFIFFRAGGQETFHSVKIQFMDVTSINFIEKGRSDIVAQN